MSCPCPNDRPGCLALHLPWSGECFPPDGFGPALREYPQCEVCGRETFTGALVCGECWVLGNLAALNPAHHLVGYRRSKA